MVLEVWKAAYFESCSKLQCCKQGLFSRLRSSTDLFRSVKKNRELSEQHVTCLLLKSHSYWNVFYILKMLNLSRNDSVRDQLEEASWQNN